MKTTIVIPIIKFNQFSDKAIRTIGKLPKYSNIDFLFVVSDLMIKNELEDKIDGFVNNYDIVVANNYSSNYLRRQAILAKTEFIYFHDCDDLADYELLNTITQDIKDDNIVYTFNVTRVKLDESGNEIWRKLIYNNTEGYVKSIENCTVSVYSKLIPHKFLKYIEFPNLPFTQDWAIAYTLFLKAPHTYTNKSVYYYYNYPTSSSSSIHDSIMRLNRVKAYSRYICKLYDSVGDHKSAEFLRFRYSLALNLRYKKIGIKVKPYFPKFNSFLKFNLHNKISVIYRGIQSIKEFLF